MESTIVFTGADENYFDFLLDCLSSITNKDKLQNLSIGILDGGLSEEQKVKIENTFAIKCWVSVDKIMKNYPSINRILNSNKERILFSQAVLHNFVPSEYNYLIWMEADMWMQDEQSFIRIFDILYNRAPDIITTAPHPMRSYAEQYLGGASQKFIIKYGQEITGNRCFMGGFNVRKLKSQFTSDYEHYVLDIFDIGGCNCFEEWAANISFYQNKNSILLHDDITGTTTEGQFGVNANGEIVNPETRDLIGIVHVAAFGANDSRAFRYPAINIDTRQVEFVSIYNQKSPRFIL